MSDIDENNIGKKKNYLKGNYIGNFIVFPGKIGYTM
jgi:hypothetical protein